MTADDTDAIREPENGRFDAVATRDFTTFTEFAHLSLAPPVPAGPPT